MSVIRTLVITLLIIVAAAIAGLAYTGTLSKAFPFKTGSTDIGTTGSEENYVQTQAKNVQFGADFDSLNYVRKTNWQPEYVTLWVGDWVAKDKYGWDTVEKFIKTAHAKGATPVILWTYWGPDISPEAIETGTNGKTAKAWNSLGEQLVAHVEEYAGNNQVMVVIEPEFNKNGIEESTEFDQQLAEHIGLFESSTADIVTVVGFGNWDHFNFLNFERSIQSADMIGINSVRFYPAHQKEYYDTVVEDAVEASRFLAVNFDQKPIIVYDFAISASENDLVTKQEEVVKEMCDRLGELEDSGVRVVIYRYLVDPVKYVPAEERHWGLIEETGKAKPALDDWLICIQDVAAAGGTSDDATQSGTAA